MEFGLTLDEDRQTVTISAPPTQRLSAADMEVLMRDLAWVRAGMLPAMPNEDLTPETIRSIVPCQRWFVDGDPDIPTQIRLYVQHLGWGWLWLPLPAAAVEAMTATMRRVLQNLPKLN